MPFLSGSLISLHKAEQAGCLSGRQSSEEMVASVAPFSLRGEKEKNNRIKFYVNVKFL